MRIEIDSVSKGYVTDTGEPLPVIDGLHAQIEEREFVCIIGPSGCGKTTLLGVLGGLQRPDSGEIRFVGDRSAGGPLTSIVWQDYALIPWRNVLDNVGFGLELRRVPLKRRREVAMATLTTMGIEAFAKSQPNQLSGGMRQRAGIARALASDPEVLPWTNRSPLLMRKRGCSCRRNCWTCGLGTARPSCSSPTVSMRHSS